MNLCTKTLFDLLNLHSVTSGTFSPTWALCRSAYKAVHRWPSRAIAFIWIPAFSWLNRHLSGAEGQTVTCCAPSCLYTHATHTTTTTKQPQAFFTGHPDEKNTHYWATNQQTVNHCDWISVFEKVWLTDCQDTRYILMNCSSFVICQSTERLSRSSWLRILLEESCACCSHVYF